MRALVHIPSKENPGRGSRRAGAQDIGTFSNALHIGFIVFGQA
jgi:hypothetical protein